METPQDVFIKGPRHLIILGQFGNLGAKLARLNRVCIDANHHALVGMIGEIVEELEFLRQTYPQLDGSIVSAGQRLGTISGETDSPKINDSSKMIQIRNRLRDMRALADAAYLSYTHEGAIACHLKVMFDHAWEEAAIETGLDDREGIPF